MFNIQSTCFQINLNLILYTYYFITQSKNLQLILLKFDRWTDRQYFCHLFCIFTVINNRIRSLFMVSGWLFSSLYFFIIEWYYNYIHIQNSTFSSGEAAIKQVFLFKEWSAFDRIYVSFEITPVTHLICSLDQDYFFETDVRFFPSEFLQPFLLSSLL